MKFILRVLPQHIVIGYPAPKSFDVSNWDVLPPVGTLRVLGVSAVNKPRLSAGGLPIGRGYGACRA